MALMGALRQVARRLMRNLPRPFYAHRDLALFFRVAPRTVTAACRDLAREGLLICRRGSGTTLAGRRRPRGTLVRGVIGIPVWVDGFAWFADSRLFFTLLEERLRQAGFAPDVILWTGPDNQRPEFGLRLARHLFDHVVWFTPDRSFLGVIRTLDECAVPQTVIGDVRAPRPFQRYSLSWRKAVRQGLVAWRQGGVREIVLGRTVTAQEPTYWVADLARKVGLACHVLLFDSRRPVAEYLRAVSRTPSAGFVFDDQYLAGNMAHRDPEGFAACLQRGPVMVLRSLDVPAWLNEEMRVDAAVINWESLVRRIVSDIANASLPSAERPQLIEARWQPGMLAPSLSSGL